MKCYCRYSLSFIDLVMNNKGEGGLVLKGGSIRHNVFYFCSPSQRQVGQLMVETFAIFNTPCELISLLAGVGLVFTSALFSFCGC